MFVIKENFSRRNINVNENKWHPFSYYAFWKAKIWDISYISSGAGEVRVWNFMNNLHLVLPCIDSFTTKFSGLLKNFLLEKISRTPVFFCWHMTLLNFSKAVHSLVHLLAITERKHKIWNFFCRRSEDFDISRLFIRERWKCFKPSWHRA